MSPQSHNLTPNESRVITLPNDEFVKFIRQDIEAGHSVTIVAKGFSMRPFIENKRDKIVLEPVGNKELKVGDVVLAQTTLGNFVLHRIVRIIGDSITLRGDGNAFGTEQTEQKKVVARASAFIRKGSTRALPVTSAKWRIYSFFWMHTLPLRRYFLYIHRHFFADNKRYGTL